MKAASPRRFLAPEVVQSSAMDCGPAALKCLFEGFGLAVSYDRLREACQTDLDGTSIDTLEQVAVKLGFAAEQVMLPLDHIALAPARAFPCLLVVANPLGVTHFVVAWRRHGSWVQVMDPATGRRWLPLAELLETTFRHTLRVPAAAWRDWAGSEEGLTLFAARCDRLGLTRTESRALLDQAASEPGWHPFAALDAALRLAGSLQRARALRGREIGGLLAALLGAARAGEAEEREVLPATLWSVRPIGGRDATELDLEGAVLVRFGGRRGDPVEIFGAAGLSPDLATAVAQPTVHPLRELLALLRADATLRPALRPVALLWAVAVSSSSLALEALLFRGLLDLLPKLAAVEQRVFAFLAVAGFLALLLALELGLTARFLGLGRRLEIRMRLHLSERLARLGDRYFRSRLRSDMAERCHSVFRLRQLPELLGNILRLTVQLAATALAIAWLDPAVAPLAFLSAALALALPLALQPALAERDLRQRNHAGSLSRFSLDALLGMVPARHHGAGPALRREQESLVVEWLRAGLRRERLMVLLDVLQALAGYGLAVWIVARHLAGSAGLGSALLLCFWAIQMQMLGQELDLAVRQLPALRNAARRLLEPLGAAEEETVESGQGTAPPAAVAVGVALDFVGVRVVAAGRTLLDQIELSVAPGEHLALVGRSGAGKSSLVGLLLGWHAPAAGEIRVDGAPLDAERLSRLRRETAWVDPEIQLWNLPLLDNLLYGARPEAVGRVREALAAAELRSLLQQLPLGLQTPLGEGGALVSGGEGQRVRLARAFLRHDARLVILDEPFRGLDRAARERLLRRARRWWPGATLLCITHDLETTRDFDRVVVIEGGRIAEQARPAELAARPDSLYRALLDREQAVRRRFSEGSGWRRLVMHEGRLEEAGGD